MALAEKVRSSIDNAVSKLGLGSTKSKGGSGNGVAFSGRHMVVFALVFGVIGSVLLLKSFSEPAPVIATVEAENMLLPDGASRYANSSASGGYAVRVTKNGTLNFTGSLNADTAKFAIRAYGSSCDNSWPKMSVAIDDQPVVSLDVATAAWQDFERDILLKQGTHKLSISFTNASSSIQPVSLGSGGSSCVRTLYLDKTTFYGQEVQPPPPPPPASPTLTFSASPTSVPPGGSATLTWSTTNADTCIASGGWSGTKAISGSESTGPLSVTTAYTLTCSGSGGSVSKSVTVTVTANPTPPPPPPSSSVTCTTQNYWNASTNSQAWTWDQCRVGTTIVLPKNTEWHCNRALSTYGTLPIKVISRWNQLSPNSNPNIAVSVDNGCTAPAGTDINLIVDVQNEGGGQISDAFKTRMSPGPQNIRITGRLGCGERLSGDHQDGVQLQGGSGIYFVNMDVGGNYDAGDANCQGAGGAMFYSINHTQASVLGGKYIACNHGLYAFSGEVAPGSEIVNAKFRSGNTTTAFCSAFYSGSPCSGALSQFARFENVTCQQYRNGQWVNITPRF